MNKEEKERELYNFIRQNLPDVYSDICATASLKDQISGSQLEKTMMSLIRKAFEDGKRR